ncbi:hypothetical protein Vretifemale_7322, partial [Volvox reticuliferus]
FLYDFRDDQEEAQTPGAAAGAPRRYRFVEVRARGEGRVSGDPEGREPAPPVEQQQQQDRLQQQHQQQQQSSLLQERQTQVRSAMQSQSAARPEPSQSTQRGWGPADTQTDAPLQPRRPTSSRQQQQQQRRDENDHQLPQRQRWDAGRCRQEPSGVGDRQEEREEDGEEGAPRQRYDYRLRLDPEKSVGGMAGALLQALSGHLVVLSEVVGPDDLYYAVKVVATARNFLRHQRRGVAAGGQGDAAAAPNSIRDSSSGERNKAAEGGGYSGASTAGSKQQQQQQQYGTASDKDEPGDGGDVALQILLPKKPYIKPRGYGRKSESDDGGGGGVTERVWRLYSHRVRTLGQSVEAPVRLYVNRTSGVQDLADKVGPAVVRDGLVVLQAAGRDAVAVALAAVVRIRSRLASGSRTASASDVGPSGGQDDAPPQQPTAAAAAPFGVHPPDADLDVAVYP